MGRRLDDDTVTSQFTRAFCYHIGPRRMSDTSVTYQVFLEGAIDGSAAGAVNLAAAMAARYGLNADDLASRISNGKFRVKATKDRATAETYAADLVTLGARCSVVEDRGAAGRDNTPLPTPPSESSPQLKSGLAAAFSGGRERNAPMSLPNLGALEQNPQGTFALTSVAGDVAEVAKATSRGSFGPVPPPPIPKTPPPKPIAKPAVPAAAPAPTPAPARTPAPTPTPTPATDRFAPMAGETGEFVGTLELDDSVPKSVRSSRPSMQPQAQATTAPQSAPVDRTGVTSLHSAESPIRTWFRNERARFVVGIAVAMVLGFIPVHIVASIREHSAYAEINARVAQQQLAADTIDSWNALDALRDKALTSKHDTRRNIALESVLLWAILGAGIGYLWFRKIDWDRE